MGLLRKNGHLVRVFLSICLVVSRSGPIVCSKFFKAWLGSEIKVSGLAFGEFLAPQMWRPFISSPSIQLSLGGLLFSRARFCLTGQRQIGFLGTAVNDKSRVVPPLESVIGIFKLSRRL